MSPLIFAPVSLLIVAMVILSISIEGTDIKNHSLYQENKMILIQLNTIRASNKKRNEHDRNNENKGSSIVNCYLKWDNQDEEKSYLEKMHNEIINMPVKETLKSLHKFGYLGYLREEVYYGDESYVMKHLFSEAWSKEDNDKKEGYCKVSSDVIKARLPKAIKITMQREKFDKTNKNKNKNKIIKTRTHGQQQQKQYEKEDYSEQIKSLKDFVQLFEQKEKEGKNPRVYVSY
jgi:hypothetical protein